MFATGEIIIPSTLSRDRFESEGLVTHIRGPHDT